MNRRTDGRSYVAMTKSPVTVALNTDNLVIKSAPIIPRDSSTRKIFCSGKAGRKKGDNQPIAATVECFKPAGPVRQALESSPEDCVSREVRGPLSEQREFFSSVFFFFGHCLCDFVPYNC